jgi:hypothetical protein
MSIHRVQTTVGLPYARAVSVLTSRPAEWLRSFLRLAVAPGFDAQTDSAPHWYRLGRPGTDPAGATVMSFVWWPHTRAVFNRFAGELVIEADGPGVTLTLAGATEGGSTASDPAVLRRLVTLLGQALVAAQDEG